MKPTVFRIVIWLALMALPVRAAAQEPTPAPQAPQAATPATPSAPMPPAGSGPVIRVTELRFHPINQSLIEPQTYLYYIQTAFSRPSTGTWVPFDEAAQQSLREDFRRLWATNFLDNLWIEAEDAPFENGVMGKRIIFHMEERPRIKIVDYTGSDKIERTKLDEQMRELGISLRLDSFLDPAAIRRTEGLLRQIMSEKGYQYAEITHTVEPLPGGPQLVKVTFDVQQGPKVKVREIQFVGNDEVGDGTLKRQMKETKEHWFLSWITGRGTYQETKFEEDAEKVVGHYRNEGYIAAQVGQPEIVTLEDSADGETRWVRLRIPVTEGPRYRVGEFTFAGNDVVREEALRPLFKLKAGDWYSEKRVRDGLEKAREVYGSGGYFEFTAFPDLKPQEAAIGPLVGPAEPTVDVTMQMQEGEQYFINRIVFTGNTTTRDNVIRRELRMLEGAVFNTEALKYSVRRLNQLGYFKPLEEATGVNVEKVEGESAKVDLTLALEEQNRNQLTFGAGVSQWEGFFGQLSFQTSNFMGRGESLTLSLQAGSRSENYQLAFTEPFLFDRNITGAVDVYKRKLQYIGQFTQESVGGNVMMGFQVADFSRMFTSYSYEEVMVSELNPLYRDPRLLQNNPFLRDSLLLSQEGGKRVISKVTPSFVFNTVDNPIFPNTGKRLNLSIDVAGLGGNTSFIKPRIEAAGFFQHTSRTSLGLRVQADYIRPYRGTETLPIFEQLFLGGEYSMRGFDIRSVGPRDLVTGLVLGGNKSLLANAEYLISIAGPVRLVLFYDAGQVRARGERFSLDEDIVEIVPPVPPLLSGAAPVSLTEQATEQIDTIVTGQRSAFKTSTGAEVRFFMPVLNVPFRLIFAWNPQRDGVLDNNFRPAKRFTFRFAVGSTF